MCRTLMFLTLQFPPFPVFLQPQQCSAKPKRQQLPTWKAHNYRFLDSHCRLGPQGGPPRINTCKTARDVSLRVVIKGNLGALRKFIQRQIPAPICNPATRSLRERRLGFHGNHCRQMVSLLVAHYSQIGCNAPPKATTFIFSLAEVLYLAPARADVLKPVGLPPCN